MSLILKPRLSEKAYELSQEPNVYVFEVPKNANKLTVATAVSEQFKVSVTSVNIANIQGKAKRTFLNRRGKFVKGTRDDIKKAYVSIKSGEKIPIFAAEEEAEKKAEEAAKKAEKKLKKDDEKGEKKKEVKKVEEAETPRRRLFRRHK